MIGKKRLINIEECFKAIMEKQIPGDLIETGVWRGGACIFMAGLNKFYKDRIGQFMLQIHLKDYLPLIKNIQRTKVKHSI